MKTLRLTSFFAAFLLLAGCSVLPPLTTAPEPSRNPAVVSLVDQAHSQSSAGQLEAAGGSLERALRIEPRNPRLWQELARIRLDEGQYRQAENLAAKSNALAVDDGRLRAENWRIIGQARSKSGDMAGAQAAFDRADREE
jgi:tetratricopeptide (TPR) repeat protein